MFIQRKINVQQIPIENTRLAIRTKTAMLCVKTRAWNFLIPSMNARKYWSAYML